MLPGTDLVLATIGSGLKESLVLHSASAPSSWVFLVHNCPVTGGGGRKLTVDDGQFGDKFGHHAGDFGLSLRDPAARQTFRNIIDDIFNNPDEIRQCPWNPKGGGGTDYLFYLKGADVVVTKATNEFVTILQGGIINGWFSRAIPIP